MTLDYNYVPDGSLYLTLDNREKLYKFIENINNIENSKIILKSDLLTSKIEILLQKLNYKRHKTTFFETSLKELNYDAKYLANFSLEILNENNITFLKDFIITSFNRKKQDLDWDLIKRQNNQYIFLVKENTKHKYLGSFSIIKINTNHYQLHSVAGNQKYNSFEFKGEKLKIITNLLIHWLKSSFFNDHSTKIIFSSSKDKLIDKYLSLGFIISNNWIIFKP